MIGSENEYWLYTNTIFPPWKNTLEDSIDDVIVLMDNEELGKIKNIHFENKQFIFNYKTQRIIVDKKDDYILLRMYCDDMGKDSFSYEALINIVSAISPDFLEIAKMIFDHSIKYLDKGEKDTASKVFDKTSITEISYDTAGIVFRFEKNG